MTLSRTGLEPRLEDLHDYQSWRAKNPRLTLLAYAGAQLSADLAIAVTKFFYPDFILHDEGVFLAASFKEHVYNQWRQQLGGDIRSIEQVMNHHHLTDLLPCARSMSKDNLVYFGTILVQAWRSALQSSFPKRRFQVDGSWDEEESDFLLVVFQTSSMDSESSRLPSP